MSNENGNARDETLTVNGTPYVGLNTYATEHGIDVKRLRRYVRNADNPPARKWDTRWLIERDCTIELPETSTRGRQRADGRQRFTVYMTNAEHDTMLIANIVPLDCVVDPRELARKRRANADA